jgi:hypothetical protein
VYKPLWQVNPYFKHKQVWIADFICLAQYKYQLQAVVSTVVIIWFHEMLGVSGVAQQLLASQRGLCFIKLVQWDVEHFIFVDITVEM